MKLRQIEDGVYIRCRTEYDARILLDNLHKIGYVWGGSKNPLTMYTNWESYEDETLYFPDTEDDGKHVYIMSVEDLDKWDSVVEFFDLVELEAGDKVVMRDDMVVGEEYGGIDFEDNMGAWSGKAVTITEGDDCCRTAEVVSSSNGYHWYLSREMFAGLADPTRIDINYDDVPLYSVDEILNLCGV